MEIVGGIIIILMAAFLVFAVLMQSGKDKRLSGAIVGGAETFFGKTKAQRWDKVLSTLTTIISIVFAILAVVMYIYIATVTDTHLH